MLSHGEEIARPVGKLLVVVCLVQAWSAGPVVSLQAARAQLAITVTTEVEDVELAVELAEGEAQDEGGRGRVYCFFSRWTST